MIELVMIGVLTVMLVYQQFMHRRTVDKLLDRLMARDLPELKALEKDTEVRDAKSFSDRQEYEIYCKRIGTIPEKEET